MEMDNKIKLHKKAVNHILADEKLIDGFWLDNITTSQSFINHCNRQAPTNIKWVVRAALSVWSSEPLSLFDLYQNMKPAELVRVGEALEMLGAEA